MELTTQQQTTAFLCAFLIGAALSLLYTMISISKELLSFNKIHVFVTDIIFMISVFLINFLYAIAMTEGRLRLYVIIAELSSFILLHFTLSKVIKCTMIIILKKINSIIWQFSSRFGKKISDIIISSSKLFKINKKLKKN